MQNNKKRLPFGYSRVKLKLFVSPLPSFLSVYKFQANRFIYFYIFLDIS